MFHGSIKAVALAGELAARFNDRQHRVKIERYTDSALVQIGSKHGTPVTVNISDIAEGVLVSMSRDRDWLDRTADASELIERAATNPISFLALLPDLVGEMQKPNIAPKIWEAINDLCGLSRALAGEKNAPQNPTVCEHCQTPNPAGEERCVACGAPLKIELPRACPKCARTYTSDALFCQSCGTRLVTE